MLLIPIIVVFTIVCLLYVLKYYYIENGGLLIVSKRFAMRRYVKPNTEELCQQIAEEMISVCKKTLDGNLMKYPFFQGNAQSLNKRLVCLFYDRSNYAKGPVAFHAPFLITLNGKLNIHAGLMMVLPEYQRMGLQSLGAYNLILFVLLNLVRKCIVTEIGASSSFLSIQEKFMYDYYPRVNIPDALPKRIHLDVAKHLLGFYRDEFGCSTYATLNEKTLVVEGSNQKAGGGAHQLITTYQTRKSAKQNYESFMSERVDNKNGDEQFFVGRYAIFHMPLFLLGIKPEKGL